MILNVGLFFWRLGLCCVIPAEARLLTWECTTNFDEIPDLDTLENLFEKEFPHTCSRLRESGGFYRIWHLVSFNSSEGRRLRFLVALVEKTFEKSRRRVLPAQIGFYAAADQMIRSKNLQTTDNDCSGNYLCYGYVENVLCILVLFEGRLCHWSEEVFAEGLSERVQETKMDQALERFRRFLKSDALFSRAKNFEEIRLQGNFSQMQFNAACRDPFWRGRDLQKAEMNSLNGMRDFAGMLNLLVQQLREHKWLWLIFVVVIAVLWNWQIDADWNATLKNAVAPVSIELSLPPEWNMTEELREPISHKGGVTHESSKPKCKLPDFALKGVVGEKLAMVSVEELSRALAVGDTLGSFTVRAIGRERIELACGDSLVVRKVGAHEL